MFIYLTSRFEICRMLPMHQTDAHIVSGTRFFATVLVSLIGLGCATSQKKNSDQADISSRKDITLYYATNRSYLGGSDPDKFFGNRPGVPASRLRLGRFPASTTFDGSDFKPGNLRIISETEWYDEVRSKAMADGKPRRLILIFVHGYNTSFTGAAESLARLESGFRDSIVPIFYTWPSRGQLGWYTADENEAAKSARYFADFLASLQTAVPGADIAIVAHSMGNRVAIAGIDLATRGLTPGGKKPFKAVALVAADIDREHYASTYSSVINQSADRVIIYASAKDKALAASRRIHDADDPRLGQNDPLPYSDKQSETVDASDAGTDFLAHGYFATNRVAINDLVLAVAEGLPAWRRPSLKPIPNLLAPKYWWLVTN